MSACAERRAEEEQECAEKVSDSRCLTKVKVSLAIEERSSVTGTGPEFSVFMWLRKVENTGVLNISWQRYQGRGQRGGTGKTETGSNKIK